MSSSPNTGFSRTQWLVLIVAAIGFAFDIYELLMLPLIIKPALAALGGAGPDGVPLLTPGSPEYVKWARMLFFIPALAGGVFGLLGGWLTDRLGRRRVLTFSILLYAFSACAAGFATSLPQLLFFRCLVFIGVCVEFVAAVAWLAELFSNPVQREKVLGYSQAFSSVGGLMVAAANVLAAKWAASLPEIHGAHEAWRYTLISGVIPALPLMIIRPFLPESPEWEKKRAAGTLKRASIAELFSPALLRTTVMTTLVFAASYGIAFGAIQQLPQIIGAQALNTPNEAGHKEIIATAKAAVGSAAKQAKEAGKPELTPVRKKQIGGNASDEAVAKVTFWQEIGGMVGRVILALLAVAIVSRRTLLRLFQIPALIFVPLLFWWIGQNLASDNLTQVKIGIFLAGLLVVGQFSFWGNYIPLVFPVHLRGTGESFAANIGGRVLGTAAAWITLSLSTSDKPDPARMAMMGACVAGAYALVGALLTQWLPEPKPEEAE